MKEFVIPLSAFNGACQKQLAIVQREWPDGVPLIQAAAERAAELHLNIDWAARRLLSDAAYEEYRKALVHTNKEYRKEAAPALEEYRKAVDHAYEAYLKAEDRAYKAYLKSVERAYEAYCKITAPALKEYLKAEAHASEEYRKATAPAYKAYLKTRALALLEILLHQGAKEWDTDKSLKRKP